MTRYSAAIHDTILSGLVVEWKLTDGEAAERMGFPLATIRTNRERLGLPEIKPPFFGPPKQRLDALRVATEQLKGFDRDAMTLNGKPIKLPDAMRLTNAELVKKGMAQIDYNPAWVVPA